MITYNISCYFPRELLFNTFFTRHKVKWLYLYDWFTTAIGDCLCPCEFVTVPKYTNVKDVRLIQEIEKMQKELVVLKNQTSAALRKKMCIKDFRPSTNASGAVWVVFLIVLAGLIIIPDMLKAVRYILLNFFQNGHSYHRRFHKSWTEDGHSSSFSTSCDY